jgi:hypothetical protein
MNALRNTLLALTLIGVSAAAQAAERIYGFSGSFDSGAQAGQAYSGTFSLDDAALVGAGEEWLSVDQLSFVLLGSTWSLADATPGAVAEAAYRDGAFLGLSFSADRPEIGVSFVAGFADVAEAYLAYVPANGLAGAGNLMYAAVPEPGALALFFSGLAVIGSFRRRVR